eukprot:GEZU01010987.1.p1 GENE.GEZU01010987.1~~GEZU01010987.1.p1  ORF type:complete len:134 (+),score=39.12 GEZU01010987.1:43-444(+)
MVPTINVKKLHIGPSNCPLEEKLNVSIDYSTDQPIENAKWMLKYVVDYTNKRHIIELGKADIGKLEAGDHNWSFTVEEINVTGVKTSVLLNVGLLFAVLYDGNDEVLQISAVTQVFRNASDQKLYRNILNPLG